MIIKLIPIKETEKEKFIKDLQSAFEVAVIKEYGKQDEEAIPRKDIEITIEINPGTITCEKVKKYKEIGINRVSIGLQTANDILLKQIGRIHSYKDFLDTYELLKINDFKNINIV